MIQAVLSNHDHPEYGVATIPFPIPDNEYEDVVAMLTALGIGDVMGRDCRVDAIKGSVPILKRLEEAAVNVDELDYLAKRLDGFDAGELAKFQGVAAYRGYSDMTDLINLTFCCQQTTVVCDFSDLAVIGRQHYMATHGGCMSADEAEEIDFRSEALYLLLNEDGKITPYGVVYDNGMVLEHAYDGEHFPAYDWSGDTLVQLEATPKNRLTCEARKTYLYLPTPECKMERALLRGEIFGYESARLVVEHNELPAVLDVIFARDVDDLPEWNELCGAFQKLDDTERQKFTAAVRIAKPSSVVEAKNLIQQLDLFDFVAGAGNAMEYGRHIIVDSGHFNYDGELDEFYDFKKWGEQRIANEHGTFTPEGYICYQGVISMEELLFGVPSERQEFSMGGMT